MKYLEQSTPIPTSHTPRRRCTARAPHRAPSRSRFITVLAAVLLGYRGHAQRRVHSQRNVDQSKACAEMHKKESAGLYNQWGSSNTTAETSAVRVSRGPPQRAGLYEHYGQTISTIVNPQGLRPLHEQEVGEFTPLTTPKARAILGAWTTSWPRWLRAITGFQNPRISRTASPRRGERLLASATARKSRLLKGGKPEPGHLAQHRDRRIIRGSEGCVAPACAP